MWIAPAGHFEYLHIDPDDNFLCIVSGSKRVRLFSPGTSPWKQNKRRKSSGSSIGLHSKYSCFFLHLKDQTDKLYPNPMGSSGFSLQTQMDLSLILDNEDDTASHHAFAAKYPKFRDIVHIRSLSDHLFALY